jgi:hypothetical protein
MNRRNPTTTSMATTPVDDDLGGLDFADLRARRDVDALTPPSALILTPESRRKGHRPW